MAHSMKNSTFEPLNSSSAASEPSELFFIECAILYQAGIDQLCDKVVVVTAPEEVRLQRTITRDHSDIDKVRARMRAQNVEEDIRRADIIINNDGNTPIPILCERILKELT
jgi:dephospho-CoA kinase